MVCSNARRTSVWIKEVSFSFQKLIAPILIFRVEMHKAFSALTKYLSYNLALCCADISSGEGGVGYYTMLKLHNDSLMTTAANKKTWQGSKSLAKEYSAEKSRHLRSLIPGIQELIADSVKTWNDSQHCRQITEEVVQIYKETKKHTRISTPDYNKFCQYVMFYVSRLNANRKIVITELKNGMVWSAEKVYKDSDGNIHVGVLRADKECIGKVVTMQKSSGATKTDETVSIFFDKNSLILLNMYRDIKNWFFTSTRSSKVCRINDC